MNLTKIINACATQVFDTLRDGSPWVSNVLNQATEDGRITIVPFMPIVALDDDRIVPMDFWRVPVTWTAGDETRNRAESQKIALAKALLENGIDSTEHMLEQWLQDDDLIIGDPYRMWFSPVFPIKAQNIYCFFIVMAVSRVSRATKNVDNRPTLGYNQ